MKLQHIDKARYRKHLNIVIGGFIATFAMLAILFGSLLIAFFSPENEQRIVSVVTQTKVENITTYDGANHQANIEDSTENTKDSSTEGNAQNTEIVKAEPPSNFRYNLAGVVLALLCCAAILSRLKRHEFFQEIYYVWQLKQLHNQIYRRLAAIKVASKNNDIDALTILYYYYKSLQQVYELDDNTLVINKVIQDFNQISDTLNSLNLSIDETDFTRDLLSKF